MSEEQENQESGEARRKDVKAEGAVPRRKPGRPPKRRQDSPQAAVAPLNGFGEPFEIRLAPGWVAFWVSSFDAAEWNGFRRWEVATWDDPRVLEYKGALRGSKGQPIVRKELTCYLMRKEDAEALRAGDPNRIRRDRLWQESQLYAESTQALGERGYLRVSRPAVHT